MYSCDVAKQRMFDSSLQIAFIVLVLYLFGNKSIAVIEHRSVEAESEQNLCKIRSAEIND